ncbi:MAG: hypothetical protein M1833_000044 [Piccolia ochrophora]|nr:MAG: hypothetical protein M1833_000044 [Piccolia ochrophora]
MATSSQLPISTTKEDAADAQDPATLRAEIARLTTELASLRTQSQPNPPSPSALPNPTLPESFPLYPSHPLLLLSDSALPLGTFAFSSGLESYLAHHKSPTSRPSSANHPTKKTALDTFLPLSLASTATLCLPFLLAAHRDPTQVIRLADEMDAASVCTVARRASVSQGRALLSVWERALVGSAAEDVAEGVAALAALGRASKASGGEEADGVGPHFAPVWGAVTAVMGLSARQSAWVFLFGQARAVVSAAVRASVLGPYQAQAVLASTAVPERIGRLVEECWGIGVEDAGQSAPLLDLWQGRHELLYSRIFNS